MKFVFNVDDIQEEVLRCGIKNVEVEIEYKNVETIEEE